MPERSYGLFIHGKDTPSASGHILQVEDPATGELVARAPDASGDEVAAAVQSARQAFPIWAAASQRQRATILNKVAALVRDNFDRLVSIEVSETGRPIREVQTVDVRDTADCFDYYASVARLIKGETIPLDSPYFDYTLMEPVGVVGQIVPWNFPLNLASWKVAPALATGNCVVLKPAALTPSSAYELGKIAVEAGLPEGVLNVVSGGAATGRALVEHPEVDMIAFTGSVQTGVAVAEVAARTGKRVALELGGKSAVIVFDDCSFDAAVSSALEAAFFANGENCCAGSRLLVSSRMQDKFVGALAERAGGLRVGAPTSYETQVGCLISMDHFRRVLSYLDSAIRDGGKIISGGGVPKKEECVGRPFLAPTIVVGVPNRSPIVQNEVFGPVLVVQTFDSDDDAVFLANSTQYDLAAGIWTNDISRAHRIARRLRAGSVWVNTFNRIFNDAPFGGLGGSGYSRDLGTQAMSQYVNIKNICICYEPGSDEWY